MTKYCVRTDRGNIEDIIQAIYNKGFSATVDPECNPVTYWINTECPVEEINNIEGVVYAVISDDQEEL